VFGTTQHLLAAALEVIVLLYFLLAAGDLFLQKLVKVLPRPGAKATAVEVAREVEGTVSRYLLTAAAINVGEGAVVAGAMYLVGLPSPLLWGVLVALLEFVPYLGAATLTVLLTLAGLTAFDTVGHALVAPATFLAINLVQANVVAPLLLARQLTLNPVAVFVGLAFWWFLWGVPGAFVAVPLLAAFKTVCDHVPALAAVGEFLGERDADERRVVAR
jgi:predicted PurR-regulated permease PerM